MTSITRLLILCAACLLWSCSGDQAKELMETAQFEERQGNLPHAMELYEEVIRLAPSSQYADAARARLSQLKKRP